MAKRGRPRKGQSPSVRAGDARVGLYVMPRQRARLNWLLRRVGADNQSDALAAALDAAGVPAEVADVQPQDVQP